MLVGSATTVVVATLLVLFALNNPYGSAVGNIRPVAMERTLRILDEAREVVGDDGPLVCDDEGQATGS
jgi:hypothetical protein